ncbi:glycosyltransferase [Haloplanus sp. C73]|uniref:glycosyltransferase n=1 Tax=Haloplanus sp. C73 TaxID=3421641 RepID=UPI003EBE09E1
MTDGLEVAAFTDTYLPTVNGVTYTIAEWAERWNESYGQMNVVYPDSDHRPREHEYPISSAPFPFYPGYRAALPWIPSAVRDTDIVHAHSVFSVGAAGWVLARTQDCPLVVSYHTPMAEYADYVIPTDVGSSLFASGLSTYEQHVLGAADLVLAPSAETTRELETRLDDGASVRTLSNGVNLREFQPTDGTAFRDRYGLDGTLVGYTGRHGFEKRIEDLVRAADRLGDVTVVLGGDGPATDDLRRLADRRDVDVRFVGFLDREELPEFYAALDVFGFPSPVETEGLVALEAIACGTPVVGADAGALRSTIDDGETGYLFEPGNPAAMADRLAAALDDQSALEAGCLAHRETLSIEATLDRLVDIYRELR